MKKIILILGILLCLSTAVHAQIVGEVLSTDITAFIDEQPIESFNINDYTYVIAEDLCDYGFSVTYNESERTLLIERDKEADRGFLAMEKVNIKKADVPFREKVFDVYETDIVTYIGPDAANAYNVNGQTLIMIDELSRFGNFSYDDSARCVKIDMAGFDEESILNNEGNETISLPCDKTEGSITYTGGVLNDLPNGYGVIHESYEFTNGLQSTENYYYSGNFKNGEKDGLIYYHGIKIPHNGSDRRVRNYYSIKKYAGGAENGYSLEISYVDNQLAARTESKGAFLRSNVIDDSYRYGYRVEAEGLTDSRGQIIDYEKTEAGRIKAVDVSMDLTLITAENGDLYAFGYFTAPDEQIAKEVPVKIDEGIAYAATGYNYPAVIDNSGRLFYLWDKIYKYNNTDVPVVYENVKKTNEEFFLTNDGKLYKKPIDYNWTMYDAPILIAEDVADFSSKLSRMMFMKNNGDVYFVRFGGEGIAYMDGLDLSKPTKVFENAKAISCINRNLVIDENNTLWGWSADTYNTPYENVETVFTTVEPIVIAEDVTSAAAASSFIAYTKTDGSLYVCPDYTEPAGETVFGILEETKILDDVKQFSADHNFLLAVKNDGTLWVWGKNNDEFLGLGGLGETDTPLQITDFYKFKE